MEEHARNVQIQYTKPWSQTFKGRQVKKNIDMSILHLAKIETNFSEEKLIHEEDREWEKVKFEIHNRGIKLDGITYFTFRNGEG